jgi:protein-tyrosine phosphatase
LAQKTRILFVCLGNIVRSPLAENMFRQKAGQAGLGHKYEVDSAGTSAYHVGESPDARMHRVASRHGLDYDGRARQFEPQDLERFDLIIAMDAENASSVLRMALTPAHRDKVRRMREFDPQGGPQASIPDPYYGGMQGFEKVYDIVERSVDGLLNALENDEL